MHVEQAGMQIGNACWELFCLEHGIQPGRTITNGLANRFHAYRFRRIHALSGDCRRDILNAFTIT